MARPHADPSNGARTQRACVTRSRVRAAAVRAPCACREPATTRAAPEALTVPSARGAEPASPDRASVQAASTSVRRPAPASRIAPPARARPSPARRPARASARARLPAAGWPTAPRRKAASPSARAVRPSFTRARRRRTSSASTSAAPRPALEGPATEGIGSITGVLSRWSRGEATMSRVAIRYCTY